MTETPIGSAIIPDPATLGRPDAPGGWTNPRGGYLALLAVAAVGVGMALLVPAVLTLSLKARIIDEAHETAVLSAVTGVAGLISLISFPVIGRISDRSTSRFGRRRPFLVLGALLIAIGAILLVVAGNLPVLLVADVLTAVGASSTTVAATATIADQFAPNRRGPASAIIGLSLPLGALIGLFIAQILSPNLTLMILVPAAIGTVGSLLFAFVLKDRALAPSERLRLGVRGFFGTFWVNPAAHPSFALAWWSRLLLFFGVAAIQAYQVFYLLLVLHFSTAAVASAVFLSTLVLVVVALVFAPIAARLSDRLQRRKPFVAIAAVIYAVGLVIAANATGFPGFLVAIGVVGLGQGVYMAVDIALVTQILPDPGNPAKDLGIMNLASTLPQAIVPAVAPVILAIGATAALPQNFAALFIAGAVAALVGAVLILPIRQVR